MTSTKGLPYGWEVAYDTSVGPYMIDHTTWKTYLPEEVPEHWLAYLNAKAGRSGRLSPRKRQKKVGNTGVRSSTPNRRQTLRRRNSQTMPSSGFHQTMSGIAENNILVGKLMKQIEGKLMKQMDGLHTELVKSRTDQTIASSKERQTVTAAVRSATKELDKLATARAKAEAKSMQDKLKFATRKTRATISGCSCCKVQRKSANVAPKRKLCWPESGNWKDTCLRTKGSSKLPNFGKYGYIKLVVRNMLCRNKNPCFYRFLYFLFCLFFFFLVYWKGLKSSTSVLFKKKQSEHTPKC